MNSKREGEKNNSDFLMILISFSGLFVMGLTVIMLSSLASLKKGIDT